MAEGGHTYEFGPPRGGWPSFDADGKRIRDDMIATLEAAALDEHLPPKFPGLRGVLSDEEWARLEQHDIARCSDPTAPSREA